MDKISVVVPIYNAEKYLEKTLQALKAQTYKNLEFILVDDGSTDNSFEICQKAKMEDARFCYKKIPNGGPSNARNIGVEMATGEYIGFCDSDDLPAPEMYETLMAYLKKLNTDIVLCDIYTERDKKNFGFPWEDERVFQVNEIRKELMGRMIGNSSDNEKESPLWGSVVRCLFKKELIAENQIKFPVDIYFAEDLVFVLQYLSNAKSAAICDKPLYFYTCNQSSIMNSFNSYKKNMFQDRCKLVSYIEKIIREVGENSLRARLTVTERCYYHECIGNACRNNGNRTKKMMQDEIKEIVFDLAVRKAFERFDAKDFKTKIKYSLIKMRWVGVLYLYYSLRFK